MSSVWDQALSMEKEGQQYYLKLAHESKSREIAGLWTFLANEEAKHYETFMQLQKGMKASGAHTSASLDEAKKMFKTMAEQSKGAAVITDSAAVYEQALRLERKSIEHYSALLSSTPKSQEPALLAIIEEEKKHVKLFEALIDFARSPKEWLESSEFNHLDEY